MNLIRRASAAVAAVMLVATFAPLLVTRQTNAFGLVAERYVKISSSTASATGVSYEIGFQVATDTTDIEGIVVEFCSNTPIIGDTCTAPTTFDLSAASVTDDATLGFTRHANTTANKLILEAAAPVNVGPAEQATFTLDGTGVTNPSTVGSFYARILTFTTVAGATGYNAASYDPDGDATLVDAGGIALSVVAVLDVTAKVQERLTFCVYTAGASYGDNNCTNKSGSAVLLGDANGVLDPEVEYVSKAARYTITTNASSGAIIRLKGETLKAGTFEIDSIGGTAALSSVGGEQFGFCTRTIAGPSVYASGGLEPSAPYNHADCSTTVDVSGTTSTVGAGAGTAEFALDTNGTTGTTSLYGQTIAQKSAGSFSTGELAFLGNISNTTEAGIYTTTLQLIATGTY